MIQLFKYGLKGMADIRKIHDPTAGSSHIAHYRNFNGEGMSVQSSTLMQLRDIGQEVRGFEAELFKYFHGSMCHVLSC